MGAPPDENLPEVVPGQAPQALDNHEAYHHQDQLNDKDPKFVAIYDDAPKYAAPEHVNMQAPYVSPINTMQARDSLVSPADTIPWEPNTNYDELNAGERSPIHEKAQERTICGLRRKIFFLLLGLTLLIIGGSVGGGVGGGLSAANNRAAAAADAQQTAPANNPAPGPGGGGSGSPTSPAPSPRPSFLNNETVPRLTWQFQAFEGFNYSGKSTHVFAEPEKGFHDLPFQANSYVWIRGDSLCCITFCKNTTYSGGYRCGTDTWQPQSSGWFARFYVGCNDDEQKQMPCSVKQKSGGTSST